MMLKDPKLFVASACLYTIPTCALVTVGAAGGTDLAAWGACLLAFAGCLALVVLQVRRHVPPGSAWRSGPTLDAAAWATAVAACPAMAFVIFAYGGAELVTAFALMLLSYPFTCLQLDEALDRMRMRALA